MSRDRAVAPHLYIENLVVIHEPVLEISCGQKQCAQTDRHTPMTTRPRGLRRAGKYSIAYSNVDVALMPECRGSVVL